MKKPIQSLQLNSILSNFVGKKEKNAEKQKVEATNNTVFFIVACPLHK